MKKQIFEIISINHPDQASFVKEQTASEIESHVFEFVEWLYSEGYSKYWGSDETNKGKWYNIYLQPDQKYYTLSEVYDYWLKEVKNE